MYLLDTNICIYFLNRRSENIIKKLNNIEPEKIALCSIVKAELMYGALKSNNLQKTIKTLNGFFAQFNSYPFDDQAAEIYSQIRSELEKKGQIIGPNDLIIASIAIANQCILITHNCREFDRIKNLNMIDWAI